MSAKQFTLWREAFGFIFYQRYGPKEPKLGKFLARTSLHLHSSIDARLINDDYVDWVSPAQDNRALKGSTCAPSIP
jgi:hypothetical protein